jgi:CHASE2 domain-containing sensor protein
MNGNSLSEWSQFAERHWIAGGILESVLWLIAGKQSLSNRQSHYAIFWWGTGIIILVALCVSAAVEKEWFGLSCGLAALFVEALWIKKSYAARGNQ